MGIVIICIAAAVASAVFLKVLNGRGGKKVRQKDPRVIAAPREFETDYNRYRLSNAEKARYFFPALIFTALAGYMFFKNVYICIPLCGISVFYPLFKKKDLKIKRKKMMGIQFRDALYSISTSLSAGKSVENAFKSVSGDLQLLYPEKDTFIIKEFDLIHRKLEMNGSLEDALFNFSARAGIEDIRSFADIFMICKNSGGNLVEVIKCTSNIISQKIEVENEIEILIAEQKFSQKILNAAPFGLLALLLAGSPEYIAPLYSPRGNLVMLVVLAILLASSLISSKITDIKV